MHSDQRWNLHEWIHAKSFVESRAVAHEGRETRLKEQSKYQVIVAAQQHTSSSRQNTTEPSTEKQQLPIIKLSTLK